jgi:hypothetical protein
MHPVTSSHAARALGLTLLAAALGALFIACGDPPPPPQFRVSFTALADAAPLAGVEIDIAGRKLGLTGAEGILRVNLRGREGAVVGYRVKCPAGYRDPQESPPLTLRQFRGLDPAGAVRGVEVTVQCRPAERLAAVVVRAGGIANIPVLMQGQPVALTDASGVAHLMLKLPPNSGFTMALDTSANPRLAPANPSQPFVVPDSDEVLVFDAPLIEQRAPTKRRRVVRQGPVFTGPVRIPSSRGR